MTALYTEFECEIEHDDQRRYAIKNFGRLALLDLSDSDLDTLAFLLTALEEMTLPNAEQVGALFERIVALLPAERRHQLERINPSIRINAPRSTSDPQTTTLTRLKRALRRQQVAFNYTSSYTSRRTLQHLCAR